VTRVKVSKKYGRDNFFFGQVMTCFWRFILR